MVTLVYLVFFNVNAVHTPLPHDGGGDALEHFLSKHSCIGSPLKTVLFGIGKADFKSQLSDVSRFQIFYSLICGGAMASECLSVTMDCDHTPTPTHTSSMTYSKNDLSWCIKETRIVPSPPFVPTRATSAAVPEVCHTVCHSSHHSPLCEVTCWKDEWSTCC